MKIHSAILLTAMTALLSAAQAGDSLESGFHNPPAKAKPHTWWHWMNGNISREGITRDLEAIADMGIGGINLFNVSCDIPAGSVDYMSKEWLDLVKHTAAEARRLGLEMGMQNCAGWATTGGPWIKPEDNMMELVHTTTQVKGGKQVSIKIAQPEARLNYYRDVAILAFPSNPDLKEVYKWKPSTLQGTCRSGKQPDFRRIGPGIDVGSVIEITNKLKKDGTLAWDSPAGDWTILRLGYTPRGNKNNPSPVSGQGLEINKLKRRGVDAHWRGGIQPVLDHLGDLAPKSLNNIVIDSYEAGNHMWSPDMREEFQKRRGYDMMPYLPAMTGLPVGTMHMTERFYWDYRRTVSELVAENYYGYFTELGHKHGLITSIEPYRGPFESMAVASKPDIPVAEFFSDMTYGRGFLKMISSAAHLYDRGLAPSEAFTCGGGKGGWRNHPATLKAAGDFAWTEGINRFIFHRFAHQPWSDKLPGMTMGPYGIHFEPTNTWWKPGRAWIEYITRSQFLLQQGTYIADALCFAGETSPNTRREPANLKAAGFDHHNCGTDIIYDLKTEGGYIVTPTGKRYRMLVLPDRVPYMTLKLAKKVQELVKNGGAVWAPKPTHSPTLAGFPASEQEMLSIVKDVWGKCDGKTVTSNRYGKGMLFSGISAVDAMKQWKVAPDVKQTGDAHVLEWIHRKTDKEDIYFISNQTKKQIATELGFRVAGKSPEFWDAENATIRPAAGWKVEGDHLTVPITLDPMKSIFVIFRKPLDAKSDPFVRVESPEKPGKVTIVKALFESVSGKKEHDPDVTEKVRGYMKNDKLYMNVGNNNKAMFFGYYVGNHHQLTINYKWKGKTYTSTYPQDADVAIPTYIMSDAYWTPGFDTDNGTQLRAWHNGEHTLFRASGKTEKVTVKDLPEPMELTGPWNVKFQGNRGAPAKEKFDQLLPWNKHTDDGIKYFSGTATNNPLITP